MNISIFAMENVATDASSVLAETNLGKANTAAEELASGKEQTAVMISVTF